jgi:hypothetical protein
MLFIGIRTSNYLSSIKIPPDLSGTKKLLLKTTRLFAESQDLILRPFHSFLRYREQ